MVENISPRAVIKPGSASFEVSVAFFLFSMYINDLEETFVLQDFKSIEIGMLKLLLLLYADDIVIFSELEAGLQQGLDILENYCGRWK